jgi:hypothetical protein
VGAWVLYLGTSTPRCEDNHPLPSSAQVKNACIIPHFCIRLHDVVLN